MSAEASSGETQKERENRRLDQLLQELRVVIPGVQVLFAFLLAVPFSSRFAQVDRFERVVFFAALLFAELSVVLLLAPTIQHRILFRKNQKPYLIWSGTVTTIAGMTALAIAMTLSLVLVSHFLFGLWAALIAGASTLIAFTSIWYLIPLERRAHLDPALEEP